MSEIPRNLRWTNRGTKDGIRTIYCPTWKSFNRYITDEHELHEGIIWRGQADATWPLRSAFARHVCNEIKLDVPDFDVNGLFSGKVLEHYAAAMLEGFTRGLRELNDPAASASTNARWALGQHYGLRTPLLDWTTMASAALFFAAAACDRNKAGNVAIWGLGIRKFGDLLRRSVCDPPYQFRVVDGYNPSNARIVRQRGRLTWLWPPHDLDLVVRFLDKGEDRYPTLYKVLIPAKQACDSLAPMSLLGMDYRLLYPDISGAALHANLGCVFRASAMGNRNWPLLEFSPQRDAGHWEFWADSLDPAEDEDS